MLNKLSLISIKYAKYIMIAMLLVLLFTNVLCFADAKSDIENKGNEILDVLKTFLKWVGVFGILLSFAGIAFAPEEFKGTFKSVLVGAIFAVALGFLALPLIEVVAK